VAALLLQGRTTRLAAVARAALLVLATLSKESFAVMFVVLLVDDWVAGRASRTRVATLAAGAGGWGFLRAQAHLASLGPFLSGRPPGALLADYLSAVGVYSSRALDPFPLSLDHPYQPLTPLALLGVAAAMAAVAALCWRSPRLAAPATLFLLGMAPIGLMLEQTGTSAERYFLGPSVGLAWALGLGIDTYFRGEPFRSHSRVLVGSLAAVVACAAGACQRLPDWQSEETIYAAAERVDPGGWFGAFHLGVVQVDQRRDPSAFPLLQRALQAALARGAPAHHTAQILNTLAGVHLRRGDPEQALKAATLALAVTPNSPAFHLQTAECFAAKGLGFEALTHLDAALSLSPSLDRARALRALLRAQTGNAAGAWADLNELRTRGASASNIEPEASDARAFLIGLH
jgi:tetratricopeptide (TPR) repeat protein